MPEENAPQKSKTGLMIAMIGFFMTLQTGVMYMMNKSNNPPSAVVQEQAEEEVIELTSPIYVQVPKFTVNVESDISRSRLVFSEIGFQMKTEEGAEFLKTHMPSLKSRMLMLIAAEKAEDLSTAAGKESLKQKILASFETPFVPGQPALAVLDVIFTEFIVQ